MKTPDKIKKGLEYCGANDWCVGDKCPYYEFFECNSGLASDAHAYIQQLEAQVPKWISVEERLPEISANAIVRFSDGYISLAQWWGDKWFKFCWRTSGTVTHWMPLPEPPKEEKTNED